MVRHRGWWNGTSCWDVSCYRSGGLLVVAASDWIDPQSITQGKIGALRSRAEVRILTSEVRGAVAWRYQVVPLEVLDLSLEVLWSVFEGTYFGRRVDNRTPKPASRSGSRVRAVATASSITCCALPSETPGRRRRTPAVLRSRDRAFGKR